MEAFGFGLGFELAARPLSGLIPPLDEPAFARRSVDILPMDIADGRHVLEPSIGGETRALTEESR
jgi:hypothetical protein